MPRRALIVGIALVVLSSAPTAATAPSLDSASEQALVIRTDRWIGTFRTHRGSLVQATAAFGRPASTASRRFACTARWPALGLAVEFFDRCATSVFQHATITARGWRTDRGLRIGDSEAKLRRLYPRARLHPRTRPYQGLQFPAGYWLIRRTGHNDCAGKIFPLPSLLARVTGARVVAFEVREPFIGCE